MSLRKTFLLFYSSLELPSFSFYTILIQESLERSRWMNFPYYSINLQLLFLGFLDPDMRLVFVTALLHRPVPKITRDKSFLVIPHLFLSQVPKDFTINNTET